MQRFTAMDAKGTKSCCPGTRILVPLVFVPNAPQQFAAALKGETARYSKMVKEWGRPRRWARPATSG